MNNLVGYLKTPGMRLGVKRKKKMLEVADEPVTLRPEVERIAEHQLTQGVVLASVRRQTSEASNKAQAELAHTSGPTPGH